MEMLDEEVYSDGNYLKEIDEKFLFKKSFGAHVSTVPDALGPLLQSRPFPAHPPLRCAFTFQTFAKLLKLLKLHPLSLFTFQSNGTIANHSFALNTSPTNDCIQIRPQCYCCKLRARTAPGYSIERTFCWYSRRHWTGKVLMSICHYHESKIS